MMVTMALRSRRPLVDLTERVDLAGERPAEAAAGASAAAPVAAVSDRVRREFEAEFPTLYPRSLGLARRFVGSGPAAEDVAAEAMARALQHWPRLDPAGRPGWVLRVTANLAIDLIRRKGRTLEPGVIHLDDDATLRLTLAAALRKLPRRQREAIALRYLADLSEEQTAAALGVSAGAVKTHVHRGLTALRRTLDPHELEVIGGTD